MSLAESKDALQLDARRQGGLLKPLYACNPNFCHSGVVKLKVSILAVLLILCGATFAATCSPTCYVSPTGNDSANGTATNPWLTINKAITATASGDTITVMDGVYNETPTGNNALYFTKSLHIVGQNKWSATVYLNQSSGNIFYSNTAGASIENLNLTCWGNNMAAALLYGSSSNVNFTNNKVSDCQYGVAMQASTTSNVKITGNYFTGLSVSPIANANLILANMTFANNTLDNSARVYFSTTTAMPPGIVIENLTILNTRNNTGGGVYFASTIPTAYPTIIRNIQCGNSTTLMNGANYCVSIQTPGNITVSNVTAFLNLNVSWATYEYGVLITGPSTNVTVENCTICSAANPCNTNDNLYGMYGISAVNVNNSFIRNNNMYFGRANNSNGISVGYNSSNNLISNNTVFIDQLGKSGISIGLTSGSGISDNNTIRNNTIVSNTPSITYGMVMGGEGSSGNLTNGIVENNVISINSSGNGAAHAILFGYTTNSTVRNNNVTGGYYNYVIKGNDNCQIYNNTGVNPQYIGIYDKGSHNCVYSNNTIQNATNSIYLDYNPTDNRTSINSTWLDNNIIGGGILFCGGATGAQVTNSTGFSAESFGSACNLTRSWWLDLSTDLNATCAITNSTGTLFYNQSATSARTSLAQYNVTAGVQSNMSNYTVTVSKPGYTTQSQNISMTTNQQLSFTLANDSSAPSITVLQPAAGYNTSNSVTINVSANGTGSPISSLIINATSGSSGNVTVYNSTTNTANCINVTDGGDIVSCQITLPPLSSGAYLLNVTATDSGTIPNTNSAQQTFTFDNVPPAITLISPANLTNTTSTNMTFNWTATDALRTSITCNLTIDGATNRSNLTVTNGTAYATTATSNFSQGNHNWSVSCWDDLNNSNSSALRVFTIDTTAPSITLISPANLTNTSNTTSTFIFTATDTLSPTLNCSFYLNNALNQSNASVLNSTATSFTLSGMASGIYGWNIFCTDLASNTGTSGANTLTVDSIPPAIALNSPANRTNTTNTNPTFNWTATDALRATIACNLTIDSALNRSSISVTNGTSYATTPTSNLSQGSHNWSISCWDDLNNSDSSATYSFSVVQTVVSGNASDINTTLPNMTATINGTNVSGGSALNATLPVNISSNGSTVLSFNFNFSNSSLNFSAISINSTTIGGRSFFTVNGIPSAAVIGGKAITIYGANGAYGSVCVKDEDNVTSITQDCSGATETAVSCDGATHGIYTCALSGTTLTVTGLTHSGIQQYQPPAAPYTSGDGSSGTAVYLSKSFNCSRSTLTIAARTASGPVSGLEVRLFKSGTRDYVSAATDSRGAAYFTVESGSYSAETPRSANSIQSSLAAFSVASCVPNPQQQPSASQENVSYPVQQPANQTASPATPANQSGVKNGTVQPPVQKPAETPSMPAEIPQITPEVKQAVADNALPGAFVLAVGAGIFVLAGAVAFYLLKIRKGARL